MAGNHAGSQRRATLEQVLQKRQLETASTESD